MGIGDWGLGIAQSPIPNPQSPNIIIIKYNYKNTIIKIKNHKYLYVLNNN